MQIRLFYPDSKLLKKDTTLKDLQEKNGQYLTFCLVNNENDFLKILNIAWQPINKEIFSMLKSHFILDNNYILQNLSVLNFYENETISATLKVFLTNNLLVIFNKKDNPFIKHVFDKLFKENHSAQESTALFFGVFLNKILENYIALIDIWSDDIANAEIMMLEQKRQSDMASHLASIRKRIVYLRTNIQDMTDQLEDIIETENDIISSKLKSFEKALKKSTTIQHQVERLNSLIINVYNLYLANLSTRQSEISKTLTMVATIFMPVTFITGFFGMNFKMPFFQNPYAYIFCVIFMVLIAVFSIMYFKKKNWM